MIAAIPTRYRGIKFRSRLEARWAAFFDASGIRWEYEPQGYTMDGTNYLPDFWLPLVTSRGHEPGLFFEIKPNAPEVDEQVKAAKLCAGTSKPVIIAASGPKHPEFELLFEYVNDSRGVWDDSGVIFAKCPDCDTIDIGFYLASDHSCKCGGFFSTMDLTLCAAREGFNEQVRWMAA